MGFNFGEFFDDAWKSVEDSVNDTLAVATPGIKASLEQWGIDTLTRMNQDTQKELTAAVRQLTAHDPAPGTFGAALSATVKNSVLETHGTTILAVVLGVLLIGIYMGRK